MVFGVPDDSNLVLMVLDDDEALVASGDNKGLSEN